MTSLDQDDQLRRLLAPLAAIEPVTLRPDRNRRGRTIVAGLLTAALIATGVAVAAGLNPFASTSQPSVNSCIATWNRTVLPRFQRQLIASGSRRGYVTPILSVNQGVPLVWPECSFSFPLPDGRTLTMTEFGFRNGWAWSSPPSKLRLRLSVELNATVTPGGYLLKR